MTRLDAFKSLIDFAATHENIDHLETLADLFALRPDAKPDDEVTVYWFNAITNHRAYKVG